MWPQTESDHAILLGHPLGFARCCRTWVTLPLKVENQNKCQHQKNVCMGTVRKSTLKQKNKIASINFSPTVEYLAV